MKDKSDYAFNWFLYNVIVVIVPVLTCLLLSSIYNRKWPNMNDILNNFILILLSILCSLLSVAYETNKQKKDICIKKIFRFTFALTFVIWSIYIVFLIGFIPNNIYLYFFIFFLLFIITCFCSYLGVETIKKNCDNENEHINMMHNNCSKIREKMFIAKYNKQLESHLNRDSDLLCDPNEFDRIQIAMNTIIDEANNHVKK